MKSVFEASTAIDAHMIPNLIEQERIKGRVDGEYLPGVAGEIQAINLVRVMVDESDYEKASQIVRGWEEIEVEEEEKTKKSTTGASAFLFGLMLGGGLILWSKLKLNPTNDFS